VCKYHQRGPVLSVQVITGLIERLHSPGPTTTGSIASGTALSEPRISLIKACPLDRRRFEVAGTSSAPARASDTEPTNGSQVFAARSWSMKRSGDSSKGFVRLSRDRRLVDDPLAPVHAWLVAAKRLHVSAIERAGMSNLSEGQKISFELVTDTRSGKLSAEKLQAV
jgi:hypothetical protein